MSKEEARRQRREEARRQRDAMVRGRRRRERVRRWLVRGAAVAILLLGISYFLFQAQARRRLVADAGRVASQASCTQVMTMPDRGRGHQPPYSYDQHPATSGSHSSPLPPQPRVYQTPVPEENAVHNLEHGYVLIYYRSEGQPALPGDVVSGLQGLAEGEDKVILSPNAELDEGTSLALAAWNRLQRCPSSVSGDQATTLARAFIAQFRGGGDAPEPDAL
jgi:hypothetical protein